MTGTTGSDGPVGLLLADKEAGPTSHDVVDRVRRVAGTRRVGHTGTLDPFASGLLLLLVGPATRLAEYFHLLDKSYVAVLRLGEETRTHDPEGETVRTSAAWRGLRRQEVAAALAEHTGRLLQRPPAFSAKRVDGRRAHRAARAGVEVELAPEEVTVHQAELLELSLPDVRVRLRVSTGTYVRSLARDVGRALGCGAHLRELRRTRIGPFRVERAVRPAGLEEGARPPAPGDAWRTPAAALGWLPFRTLDDEEAGRVGHGASVPIGSLERPSLEGPPRGPPAEELPVPLLHGGRLLAVAERREGRLQPRKVFRDAA